MTTSLPLEEPPAKMITSTPAKPTARPSTRRAVIRSSSVSRRDHGDEERRRVEQHSRDRRPGADGPLGESDEGQRSAAESHQRREPPEAPGARQPGAEQAEEREHHEEAERAARERRERGRRVAQRDLGHAEGGAPEDHRDEQQQRNRDACVKTSQRRVRLHSSAKV